MPQNNNTEVTKQLRDGLKINQAYESVPNEIGKTIVPVFISNPQFKKINFIDSVSGDNSGTAMYTVPVGKRLILKTASLSVEKDAAATTTNVQLRITMDGEILNILYLGFLASTAGAQSTSLNYGEGILLTAGESVSVGTTGYTTVTRYACSITGILEDD